MRDLAREIYESIRRNRLRTTLTGFSVAWGIFMLIVLLGAGNGLINSFSQGGDSFLSNTMDVRGGWTSKPYDGLKQGRPIDLTEKDVETTTGEAFSDVVDEVTATISLSGQKIVNGKDFTSPDISGVYPAHGVMNKCELVAGRFINDSDISSRRKVIVVSSNDVYNLFGNNDCEAALGKRVKVGNLSFRIVGVSKADERAMWSEAYMPFTTMKFIYRKGEEIEGLTFTFHGLDSKKANEDFETKYRAIINSAHRAAPDDTRALMIWNRFTQNLQMNTVSSLLQIALWIIGIFTLLSGIVGVSNIMLITVKERTHEFGIRKAIGATPRSIMALIITESISITAIFGYIGMFLGMIACEQLDKLMGSTQMMGSEVQMLVNPGVGLDVAVEATVLLVVAGTIAGIIPARKAAQVKPIEALNAK